MGFFKALDEGKASFLRGGEAAEINVSTTFDWADAFASGNFNLLTPIASLFNAAVNAAGSIASDAINAVVSAIYQTVRQQVVGRFTPAYLPLPVLQNAA